MQSENSSKSYSRTHPFMAKVKERLVLNKPGSKKCTFHIVLDLTGSGIDYEAGDSIGVIPTNHPDVVEKMSTILNTPANQQILHKRSEQERTVGDLLSTYCDLNKVTKPLIRWVCEQCPNSTLEELLATDQRANLKAFCEKHHVWDFLEEYLTACSDPTEVINLLSPLLPRLYSIASSRHTVGQEVHLTVAHVNYQTNGKKRLGVCSDFLFDRSPVNELTVPVYLNRTKDFRLPADKNLPIIMIGPGTGIAPFRAFMQERIAQKATGEHWLFFGDWNRATDFYYEEFWKELEANGTLRLDLAFSRDQPNKIYVQDRMLEASADLWRWIEKGAVIYLCGDALKMAKDVDAALHQIVEKKGGMSSKDAQQFVKQLRKDQRYLRDIY